MNTTPAIPVVACVLPTASSKSYAAVTQATKQTPPVTHVTPMRHNVTTATQPIRPTAPQAPMRHNATAQVKPPMAKVKPRVASATLVKANTVPATLVKLSAAPTVPVKPPMVSAAPTALVKPSAAPTALVKPSASNIYTNLTSAAGNIYTNLTSATHTSHTTPASTLPQAACVALVKLNAADIYTNLTSAAHAACGSVEAGSTTCSVDAAARETNLILLSEEKFILCIHCKNKHTIQTIIKILSECAIVITNDDVIYCYEKSINKECAEKLNDYMTEIDIFIISDDTKLQHQMLKIYKNNFIIFLREPPSNETLKSIFEQSNSKHIASKGRLVDYICCKNEDITQEIVDILLTCTDTVICKNNCIIYYFIDIMINPVFDDAFTKISTYWRTKKYYSIVMQDEDVVSSGTKLQIYKNNFNIPIILKNDTTIQSLLCDGPAIQSLSCDDVTIQSLSCDDVTIQSLSYNNTATQSLSCNNTATQSLSCNDTATQNLPTDNIFYIHCKNKNILAEVFYILAKCANVVICGNNNIYCYNKYIDYKYIFKKLAKYLTEIDFYLISDDTEIFHEEELTLYKYGIITTILAKGKEKLKTLLYEENSSAISFVWLN